MIQPKDILYAFAVEPNHEQDTLYRYIKRYSHLTDELKELSKELHREVHENIEPLSESDKAVIEKSLNDYYRVKLQKLSNP